MSEFGCNNTEWVYRQFVYPCIFTFSAISMIPSACIFISAYIRDKQNTHQTLFYFGLFFFTIAMIYFLFKAIYYGLYCKYGNEYEIMDIIPYYLYPLQGLILVLFLFLKLIRIFESTDFVLSKCIKWLYSGLVIMAMSSALIGQSFIRFTVEYVFYGLMMYIFASVMYIFIIIWLNCIFLYKLYIVYKTSKNTVSTNNEGLMQLITKTSVLCFVSTACIVLYLASFYLTQKFDSPHVYFMSRIILIVDIYTNYASILLSHTYFDEMYFKICGCCHRGCHLWWINCSNKDQELKLSDIISTSKSDLEDETCTNTGTTI